MRKSLELQAEMTEEFGACVFDVTLDCEDGAPVGGEADHAALVVALLSLASDKARVAVRIHPAGHPAFEQDIATVAGKAGRRLCHVMIPKVESVRDVERACEQLEAAGAGHLPLQALIESPAAVHRAFDIAAHPRIQSLSFGLMDFVSAHGGAIPSYAHGPGGAVHAPAGGSRQAGDRLGLPCARQGAGARGGDGIQGQESPGCRGAQGGARDGFHADVEHPPGPDPAHPGGFRAECARDRDCYQNNSCGGPGGLGTDQLRGQAGGQGELPLLLAGAGEGAPAPAGSLPPKCRAGSTPRNIKSKWRQVE